MEKTVEEGGTSNFQECFGAISMCLSKYGLFKTWSVFFCGQTYLYL